MNNSLKVFWWHFQLELPDVLEESIVWKLRTLGIGNFSIEFAPDTPTNQLLSIWLPSSEWCLLDLKKLFLSFEPLAQTFEIRLSPPRWNEVDDEDWNLMWKKHWKPDPVGSSLLILPVWLNLPNEFSSRKIVRLDPGSAFGTGSHPTTRLCLEALELEPPIDLKVADIGCGSGILGLTALSFGATEVFAVDTDSLAVSSTLDNFAFNNFENSKLSAFQGSIDVLQDKVEKQSFDLLLCNILAPVIKKLSPAFDSIISSKGRGLLSGILCNQVPELSDCLKSLGWGIVRKREKENWALLEIFRN